MNSKLSHVLSVMWYKIQSAVVEVWFVHRRFKGTDFGKSMGLLSFRECDEKMDITLTP